MSVCSNYVIFLFEKKFYANCTILVFCWRWYNRPYYDLVQWFPVVRHFCWMGSQESFIVQKLKKNKGLHFLTKQIFVYMTTLKVYYIAFFLSALKKQQPLLQYWHHNQGSVCPFYSMVVCSRTDLYIIFSYHVLRFNKFL